MPGATPSATAAPTARGASTIGRAGDVSSATSASPSATSARAAATSAAMSANGRSSRCLRARSRATAGPSSARHARWKPPIPFTATIAPAARARAARSTSSRPAGASPTSRTRGPQTGHALGCAWKRRSDGSSYSAWQAGHIANPAIVVSGRSYGTPRTIVNRGPQFVQFTNG